MAKKKLEPTTGKTAGTKQKSKAQQAVGKNDEEIRIETRNRLVGRLVGALLLFFLGLFLILTMFGVRAAVLNGLRGLFRGLFGYGYWLSPIAFIIIDVDDPSDHAAPAFFF